MTISGNGAPLNPRVPFIVDIIFPIAALAPLNPGEAVDRLDPLDIFGLLVAELALDAEAQRGAVGDRQKMAVQPPGDQRLRMEGINQVNALVIRLVAEPIGTMKHDIFGATAQARMLEQAR